MLRSNTTSICSSPGAAVLPANGGKENGQHETQQLTAQAKQLAALTARVDEDSVRIVELEASLAVLLENSVSVLGAARDVRKKKRCKNRKTEI